MVAFLMISAILDILNHLKIKVILNEGSDVTIFADTDVSKTSSGCLEKVATSYDQLPRRLEKDVGFMTSWRRVIYVVLKMPNLPRLEDVCFTTSSGCVINDVLKMSDLYHHEDVQFGTSWKRLIYYVLTTSDLCRLEDVQLTICWRRLIYAVLKTSIKGYLWQRRSNVYTTSKGMIFSYFVLCEIFKKI